MSLSEMSDDVSYAKEYAVYSDINKVGDSSEQLRIANAEIDNLIHESGKLQLNTYQAFVQTLMDPRSDARALLLCHMTGTGKTITALATATEYVRQHQSESSSVASIVVLGFTSNIFRRELFSHPEFTFTNKDEVKELKELEQRMHESVQIAERYANAVRRYRSRLSRKKLGGIYQFYGYRQFANRIINMVDLKAMAQKISVSPDDIGERQLQEWIKDGAVRINIPFIESLARSFFICDEVHNTYTDERMNIYGIAIKLVLDHFYQTTPTSSPDHASVRMLLLSATPLTSSALEIIPIANLLTGESISKTDVFKTVNGVDEITAKGVSIVRRAVAGSISYIMDDNPNEYPVSNFVGEQIPGIPFLKFVRTTPSGLQLKSFEDWASRTGETGNGMSTIKDITFPATKSFPSGTPFIKSLSELKNLPSNIAVRRNASGSLVSNIFKRVYLGQYSSKYLKLVEICDELRPLDQGKAFIYHPYVQGGGTDLICAILSANGFVMDGHYPVGDSVCLHCDKLMVHHEDKKINHEFEPVRFTFVNGNISKREVSDRLAKFNNEENVNGENLKFIIGSQAMREGHTLHACRHVIIVHEPSSISEMVQIIGRAVRKHVHALLPKERRQVQIRILTTSVVSVSSAQGDTTLDEEQAYRQKVARFEQINRIEKIMFDVSIDYLINFRFKVRETPLLIGNAHELDESRQKQHATALTKAYAGMRRGTAVNGISTSRFNLFYFENEVGLVVMIIKRVLISFQPLVTIARMIEIVRAPPFHVEYNTNLISDSAIICAIHRIRFDRSTLRVKDDSVGKYLLADALFDKSPIIVGPNGNEYFIVCVGDPNCLNSYLTKQSKKSVIRGDRSIIDSFRDPYISRRNRPIDLRDAASQIGKHVNADDLVSDLGVEWTTSENKLHGRLQILPMMSQIMVLRYAIEKSVAFSLKQRRSGSTIPMKLIRAIIEYYSNRGVVIIVQDLRHTIAYDIFKRLDVRTGQPWYSSSTKKPATASMPVGHILGESIQLFQPTDRSWLRLSSVMAARKEGDHVIHPLGFYIFEDKSASSTMIDHKIKFTDDLSSKGINLQFVQLVQLMEIAAKLKASGGTKKSNVVATIIKAAKAKQESIHPKRVYYKFLELR